MDTLVRSSLIWRSLDAWLFSSHWQLFHPADHERSAWSWTPLKKYMGVSKNRGTPKWMVDFMENPIKIDYLGVPLFLETPIWNLKTLISKRNLLCQGLKSSSSMLKGLISKFWDSADWVWHVCWHGCWTTKPVDIVGKYGTVDGWNPAPVDR